MLSARGGGASGDNAAPLDRVGWERLLKGTQGVNPIAECGDLGGQLSYLQSLADELRAAIRSCLVHGRPDFAVALDTARDLVEGVLAELQPTSTRIGVARARAEIALEIRREARDARH